jgi:glycosyltransferase involved in cell wall biosynthesis
MMRIYQLSKHLERGGAEVLMAAVSKELSSRCRFKFGYFMPGRNTLERELCARGDEVECLHAPTHSSMFLALDRVRRSIRSFSPDVVHCHLPLVGVVGRLAARMCSVPVIYTEHNLFDRYHPMTRAAALATWRLQRRVIAVSTPVKDALERCVPGSVPVSVVPNAVDVDAFANVDGRVVRERYGIAPNAAVIGTVTVFREAKRLDLWLQVARAVAAQVPGARFLLVGFGPLEARLRGWVDAAGLGDAVILPGGQDDVRPFLAAFDVFLMSSDYEGLPIALLEAMAAAVPVVATGVGGIPEVVRPGHGILVGVGDVDGLARETVSLLGDPTRRAQLGQAGRARVRAVASIARMADDVYQQYAAVAGDTV